MNWLDSKLESIATFFVELSGNGYDPDGSRLPAFKEYKPPSIKPPQPKKKAQVVDDMTELYSDEEINAMSESEFSIKVGGAKNKQEFARQSEDQPKKQKAVVFDDLDSVDHGITEREYGEMMAYTPVLRDCSIAAKVKAGIAKGKTLQAIATETRQPYQLIRHYSSALNRAKSD